MPKVGPLVEKTKEYNMPSVALTDRNNLYGAIEFYKTCTKKGIKPIIGCDLDINLVDSNVHFIFIAENNDGYKNLVKLVSVANLNDKQEIKVEEKDLEKYKNGLIVLIPEGAINSSGRKLVEKTIEIFGGGNVYARIGWNDDKETQTKAIEKARELGIKPVAGDGTYYLSPEDRDSRDIVRRIADPSAPTDGKDRSFISQEIAKERYREFPEALTNVEEIVNRVNVTLELGSWNFPNFPIPEGSTHKEELAKLAEYGFKLRGLKKNERS